MRRIFAILSIAIAAAAVCLAYAYFIEPDRLVVTHSTLGVKNLNPAFDGLKIVMLGDVHGGSNSITAEKLRLVAAKINEQNPELVVMLGDYVSSTGGEHAAENSVRMPIATIADNLAGIRAPHGVFAVLGNHDAWQGEAVVAAEFGRVGYRVLQNETAVIERNGQRLRIYGMKDHLALKGGWLHTSAEARANLKGDTGDVIVLQHSPDIIQIIAGEMSISPDLRLILAAHTHGGQVRFPVLGTPVVPSGYGQKYARGHIREKGVDMYVTSGIGTSLLPLRFLVPPEIVVLTLRAETGAN